MTDQIREGDDPTAATVPAILFTDVMSGPDIQTGGSAFSTIGTAIADGYIYVSNLFKADPKVEQQIEKCMDVRARTLGVVPDTQRKFCDESTPMFISGDSPVAIAYGQTKR